MKRNIIGILGRSRVGKDTVAKIIKDVLEPTIPFEIHHIAKPLKDSVMGMYHFTSEQMDGSLKDVIDMRYGHSPRELCIIWNNKLSHLHGSTFLIHRFFEESDKRNDANIIIPDVRFPHDCYEIQRRGGILLKVMRVKTLFLRTEEAHIDQLPANYIIHNDSTSMEELQQNILDNVIPSIKSKMTRSS